MDVRCPRCHVEYEFDDDKVTSAGVAVQCTGCGHVFRVASGVPRAASVPPIDVDGASKERVEWMVRQHDGRVIRFKELTTLQKWIVEQKVAREDEISRTGRTWRPLGDIAELSSFFQVVDAARAAQQLASKGLVSAPVMPPPHTVLPPVELAQHTAHELALPAAPGATPPRATPTPTTTPSIHTASTETFFGAEPSLDALDDDDPVRTFRARQRARRAALVVALVIVTLGVIAVVVRPRLLDDARALVSGDRATRQALVERARAALVEDADGEVDAVDVLLAKNLGDRADDGLLHALRARTLVARARAASLRATSSTSAPAAPEGNDQLLAEADGHVIRALADEGAGADARLASADVQAARGALLEMDSDLERAVASDPSPDVVREAAVIRALAHAHGIARAPSDEARRARAREAEDLVMKARALARDDTRLVVAHLMARRAGADLDQDAVKRDVEGAIAAHPFHLGLRALRGVPSAAPVVVEPPAASADLPAAGDLERADTARATSSGSRQDATKPTLRDDEADDDAERDDGGDATQGFDALLARAERLRRADRSRVAVGLYQKAAKANPNDARPHVGLGFAYLDLDRASQSIAAFEKAAALDPRNADAQLGLGEAHRARGAKASAITAFKRYLELAPAGDEAAVAKRAIAALEASP